MALLHWPIFLRCVVCDQASQSRGFCKDMWLEAVNPLQPSELCVARITQVKGRLLWLRLEGRNKQSTYCMLTIFVYYLIEISRSHDVAVSTRRYDTLTCCWHGFHLCSLSLFLGLTKPQPDCIVDVESMNIFPVGWCEANGYPLTHLLKTVCECQVLMVSYMSVTATYAFNLTLLYKKEHI